jgi:hypothetical protein
MADYSHIYFIGIGGIGMSAIARYYNAKGGKQYKYLKEFVSDFKSLEIKGGRGQGVYVSIRS